MGFIYLLTPCLVFFIAAAGSSYLPCGRTIGFAVRFERSGLPKIFDFGESGGIERFQLAKRVLCASIAERERKLFKLFSTDYLP